MKVSKTLVLYSCLETTVTKKISKKITYVPWIWIKNLSPCLTPKVNVLEKLLNNSHGSSQVCSFSQARTKRTIVQTYKKSDIYFFNTKAKPTTLCNPCDYVLQFFFQIGTHWNFSQHSNWLSLQTWAQSYGKIREDMQPTPIDVTKFSSYGADAERFFFTHADNANDTKNGPFNVRNKLDNQ